jgi:purine-nucleoside phosphorylase
LRLPADTLAEGTYCWVAGPTYETVAEGAFLRSAGGDVVGASTVPEVFAARQQGMEVLVLSLVTNMVTMCQNNGVKEEVQAELVSSVLSCLSLYILIFARLAYPLDLLAVGM